MFKLNLKNYLSTINRFQETQQVLVKHNDQLIMKPDYFIDDWDEVNKLSVIRSLRMY